jgi:phosphoribosylformimino-5-aminoimidazole carboxamide ribotide isomerase
MILLPAIDLYDGKAVRLYKGDYTQMTVYSDNPLEVARSFCDAGASYLHVVDLEGARDGTTANFNTIQGLVRESGLKVEVGGGIRSREVIAKYCDLGACRVILGTAAITQPGFVEDMVKEFGEKIAVGADIRDGFVAIKGWTETTDLECLAFCRRMEAIGVETIICTDISKDGVLGGTNLDLYRKLADELTLDVIASGGVSSLEDITALCSIGVSGAILGKALYEGKLSLKEAVDLAREMRCCE